jgi:hypothetical protein
MQTRVGSTGNCFAACLASILEIPLTSIPDFTDRNFLPALSDFLLPFDLYYAQISPDDEIFKRMSKFGDLWHTIEGISVRGGLHACVGRNGVLVHDPHPGAPPPNLVTVECYGLICSRMAMTGVSQPNSGRL